MIIQNLPIKLSHYIEDITECLSFEKAGKSPNKPKDGLIYVIVKLKLYGKNKKTLDKTENHMI